MGRPGADRDQDGGLEGEDPFQQRAGRGPGNVGVGELYGLQAAFQGFQQAGADRLVYEDQGSRCGVSEGRRVPGFLQTTGYAQGLLGDFLPVVLFRASNGSVLRGRLANTRAPPG